MANHDQLHAENIGHVSHILPAELTIELKEFSVNGYRPDETFGLLSDGQLVMLGVYVGRADTVHVEDTEYSGPHEKVELPARRVGHLAIGIMLVGENILARYDPDNTEETEGCLETGGQYLTIANNLAPDNLETINTLRTEAENP